LIIYFLSIHPFIHQITRLSFFYHMHPSICYCSESSLDQESREHTSDKIVLSAPMWVSSMSADVR
jgi:hypothetical protein